MEEGICINWTHWGIGGSHLVDEYGLRMVKTEFVKVWVCSLVCFVNNSLLMAHGYGYDHDL